MNLPRTTLLAALGLTIGYSASAHATLLFEESFDYTPGDLSTESGTWSDTGSTLEAGSLTYGNLATSGNRVTMSDDTSWIDTGTAITDYLNSKTIGELWFSVLINTRVGTNPDFGFALATDSGRDVNNIPLNTTNGGDGLGFRVKGNNGGLIAANWSGGAVSNGTSTGISQGTTYLVVGIVIFDTINNLHSLDLYLPDTDLNLGSGVASHFSSDDITTFNIITFMDKAASPRDQVDEIRFGTTSASVLPAIPEPSSLALLGLGALCVARRRRRG